MDGSAWFIVAFVVLVINVLFTFLTGLMLVRMYEMTTAIYNIVNQPKSPIPE